MDNRVTAGRRQTRSDSSIRPSRIGTLPDVQIGSPVRRPLVGSKHAVEGLTKPVALEITKSESLRTAWRLVLRTTTNAQYQAEEGIQWLT